MMTAYISRRTFQLWEYHVSHGSLLVRSPSSVTEGIRTNVDIICTGVEYIALPRFIRGVEILEACPEELQRLKIVLGKDIVPSSVRVLKSKEQRFQIVAATFVIEENERDIFDSPFQHA
jgi:hypothetical protein